MYRSRRSESYYETMQVCLNGHLITERFHSSPEHRKKFCDKCGIETIFQCPKCNTDIRGKYIVPGVVAIGFRTPVPKHCHECGTHYPWVKAKNNVKETDFLPFHLMKEKLKPAIRQFNKMFPLTDGKRVFIMSRFRNNEIFNSIITTIIETLKSNELQGFVASDYVFDDDSVWANVNVYMFCCEFGVAVLEQIVPDERFLNPNVLLELGCMMGGLGKPCLVMKEINLRNLPSDIVKIYESFEAKDVNSTQATVRIAVQNWIDRNLKPRGLL